MLTKFNGPVRNLEGADRNRLVNSDNPLLPWKTSRLAHSDCTKRDRHAEAEYFGHFDRLIQEARMRTVRWRGVTRLDKIRRQCF
jgi:hypothetical protein